MPRIVVKKKIKRNREKVKGTKTRAVINGRRVTGKKL